MTLEIQAYLDNELTSEADVKRVATLLRQDGDAALLFKELKDTRQILVGNEYCAKLPGSPEFYWSGIQRAIEKSAPAPRTKSHVAPWWIRLLIPLAGTACVGLLLSGIGIMTLGGKGRSAYLHEIETSIDDASAISFHSQSQGMTVVWVKDYNR